MGCTEVSLCCCTEINIHIDLRLYEYSVIYSLYEYSVSGNLCSFLKEVKALVLYAVEYGRAMEPMKGKWASSRVDLGYTEKFCISEMTSVFTSSCDSVLGDSLGFHQENRASLCV